MASSPDDFGDSGVDLTREETQLREMEEDLGEDKIELHGVIGGSTLDRLSRRLQEVEPDIFHFMGHGGKNEGRNCLVFCTDDQKAQFVDALQLRQILPPSVRLVVLNCCESGAADSADGFGSIAAHLARTRIPAVVAMQYPITNDAATEFSKTFFRYVLTGHSLDAALATARQRLSREYGIEWGVPLLHLQASSTAHMIAAAKGSS
jgi:CHAT domain-containing protein